MITALGNLKKEGEMLSILNHVALKDKEVPIAPFLICHASNSYGKTKLKRP